MARRPIQHDLSAAYVYGISVDGVIRYVGKGRRYRIREHLRIANFLIRRRAAGERVRASKLYNKLASAITSGCTLGETVFADGLTDEDAFRLEVEKIGEYPRGQLWNLSSGGEGFSGDAAKALWTPERREQHKARLKARWADPKNREQHGATIRSQWEDADYRKHHISKQIERWGLPGAKERASASSRARWAVPGVKEAASKQRQAIWALPEAKKKRSEVSTRLWQDSKFREKQLLERKSRWDKPGARKRQSLVLKAAAARKLSEGMDDLFSYSK